METKNEGSSNPFTRFAFGPSHDDSRAKKNVKSKEDKEQLKDITTIKQDKKLKPFFSRQAKVIKTELTSKTSIIQCSDTLHLVKRKLQLELLIKLYETRKKGLVVTPIDKFGTQRCVAAGVSSAKVERFQLLVAALLSSQTQDPITFAAMQRLHRLGKDNEGLTIEVVQVTDEKELSEVLKPVGFYHRKARQLKQVAAILHTQYQGDIPRSLDKLLELPGIGPKIGCVITLLAWGQVDGIVVDTHVHRVAQRLGWASTSKPEDTKRELEEWIPRKYWGDLSLAVVGFGQTVCTAKYPSCSTCSIAPECPSAFKVETTSKKRKKRPAADLPIQHKTT